MAPPSAPSRPRPRAALSLPAAAIAFSALAAGCAAGKDDPLIGTWTLGTVTCDGTVRNRAAATTFQVTYGADGVFYADLSTNTCTLRRLTGTYKRDGLTVTEIPTTQTCSSGCVISQLPGATFSCDGVSSYTGEAEYLVNIRESGEMEQSEFKLTTFCPGNGNRYVDEVESFTLNE